MGMLYCPLGNVLRFFFIPMGCGWHRVDRKERGVLNGHPIVSLSKIDRVLVMINLMMMRGEIPGFAAYVIALDRMSGVMMIG